MSDYRIVTVRSALDPAWWRHPIRWWKLRHWRNDTRDYYANRTPLQAELDREMDRAFLFGTPKGDTTNGS